MPRVQVERMSNTVLSLLPGVCEGGGGRERGRKGREGRGEKGGKGVGGREEGSSRLVCVYTCT